MISISSADHDGAASNESESGDFSKVPWPFIIFELEDSTSTVSYECRASVSGCIGLQDLWYGRTLLLQEQIPGSIQSHNRLGSWDRRDLCRVWKVQFPGKLAANRQESGSKLYGPIALCRLVCAFASFLLPSSSLSSLSFLHIWSERRHRIQFLYISARQLHLLFLFLEPHLETFCILPSCLLLPQTSSPASPSRRSLWWSTSATALPKGTLFMTTRYHLPSSIPSYLSHKAMLSESS